MIEERALDMAESPPGGDPDKRTRPEPLIVFSGPESPNELDAVAVMAVTG